MQDNDQNQNSRDDTQNRRDDKKKRPPRQEPYLYGHAMGVKVINGNLESALRAWKRIVKDSGIMDELRDRKEYIKPTTKRREAKNQAIRTEWVRRRREE